MGKRKSSDDKDGDKRNRRKLKKEKRRLAGVLAVDSSTERNHGQSCLQRKKVRLIISLLPAALADIERACHISLRGMLLKYSDSLGGVLLAYDKIIIENETMATEATSGLILNELPNIHFRVITSMLIFTPDSGEKVMN